MYDSFTITILLLLEDLGFCEKGQGGPFVREHLRVGGPLPINTDGGGLSAVHPGMRGMFLMTEAVRQIRDGNSCHHDRHPGWHLLQLDELVRRAITAPDLHFSPCQWVSRSTRI